MTNPNMILVYVLLSYLLGSVSGSLLMGKIWNVDIRNMGSGNAGGTNALRSVGITFAILTFIIDLFKGALPAYLSQHNQELMLLCGFSAMIGHVYPIFYNFRGGKGAGTLLGVLIIANPSSAIFIVSIWIIMVLITGFVGLSTITACAVLFLYSLCYDISFIIFSMTSFIFIVFTHRSNIKRMLSGEENQFKKVMIFKRK